MSPRLSARHRPLWRGYRSFESTYTKCTASATEAIGRYTVEGENLARDLAARYGN